jgi:hypothetical protein
MRRTTTSSSVRAGLVLAIAVFGAAGCGTRPYQPPPPEVQEAVKAALTGTWQGTIDLGGDQRPVTLAFTAGGGATVTVAGPPSAALPNPTGSGGWSVRGVRSFSFRVSSPTAPGTATGVTSVELSQDGTLDDAGQRLDAKGQGVARAGTTTVGLEAVTITATKVAPAP